MTEERRRRSLSNRGGKIRTRGDARMRAILGEAWARASTDDPDTLTHGFHSWPARMHPSVARVVLEALGAGATRVVDPFCGGGTVLIEARRLGLPAVGIDLNPLSAPVARVRCQVRDDKQRARFLRAVERVSAASEERVRARTKIRVPLSNEELAWFDVHVVKELGGLLREIRTVRRGRDQEALEVVFSSILTKVSKQRADTAQRQVARRIRKGLTTEIFKQKGEELERRWASLTAAAADGPDVRVEIGDARELGTHGGAGKASLILTSPPYGGTYDYANHHARRLAWLGLDGRDLHAAEIGARRDLSDQGSDARWDAQVRTMLHAFGRTLAPEGLAVLVVGDAEVGQRRVSALGQLNRLAPGARLRIVASASQPRADQRGGRARAEHLVALRKSGALRRNGTDRVSG